MEWVHIRAPARLHLGFIPPVEGESMGSAAVAISEPYLALRMREHRDIHVSGPYSHEFFTLAWDFMENHLQGKGLDIVVENAIRRHTGLGSGTRMAMAVGMGTSALYHMHMDPYEIADFFGRGRNSRAGLETLLHGGISVVHPDGNISNIHAPEDWVFVVAIPEIRHRFFGERERSIMGSVGNMRSERDMADEMVRALKNSDVERFGEIMTELDRVTGRIFGDFQRGENTFEIMERLRDFGLEAGAYGAGQSSWGPAVYFLTLRDEAGRLMERLREFMGADGRGSLFMSGIAGSGIEIDIHEENADIMQGIPGDNRIVYKS